MTRSVRPAAPRRFLAVAAALCLAAALALLFSTAQAQDGAAPGKPRGLTATPSPHEVVLTWDDPGDASITGYVILRRVRVNNTGGDFSVLVADTGTAALTYTDNTVAAGLTYTYRIKAINEHGVSERSRWFHVDTPAAPVPDKPRGLEAAATHDSVTLSWDDPGDDSITGYLILRRVPGVDPQGHFNELVADTGTAATTYTDDTVAAETRYTYRIKAINGAGTSERSRWFHIDTPAAPEAAEGDDPGGKGGRVGGGAPGGPGNRANVAEPSDGDCAASTSTTCEVDVGGSVTGNIESGTDKDWFKVDLEMGKRYQIDLEGEDTGRGTLGNPFLTLYDASGSSLMVNDIDSGVGLNARLIYAPTANGTYYVQAADPGVDSNFGGATGTYTLSVIVLGANGVSEADDDFPVTTATTGRVEVGASATGNIDRSFDQDWFRLDLEAGKTYQIDLEGDTGGGGTLGDPYLRNIRDSSGTEISGTENDDIVGGVADSRVVFTPTADGAYYLVASGFDGTYTGTYTLSVTELETRTEEGDTDFASDVTTLGRVEVGGSATGEIENVADADWFRVVLEKDKTYVFDLEGTETSSGTLADPILLLRDASGSTLEGDDDGGDGANSRLEYTATADGIHYLTATTPTSATSGGTYTLSVREAAAPDDCSHGTTTTCEVDVGGSATGTFETDIDRDWFKVELEAGTRYQIDVEGADTGRGTLANPGASLYDSSRTLLGADGVSGVGKNARVTYTPTATGAYYVQASNVNEQGTYTLSVIVLGANGNSEADTDFRNNNTTSGRVDVGASATGSLGSSDTDWFRVDLTAGRQYQIDMEGVDTGRGTYTDPYFQLFEATGVSYRAENDDGGEGKNARVTYTPATSGRYFVAASRGLTGLSATGTYTLSVRDVTPPPDLPANATTSGVVEVDGAAVRGDIYRPVEEAVTWTTIVDGDEVERTSIVYDFDTDWFAVQLEAGQTYRIDMKGAIPTNDLTLRLPQINAIYGSNGGQLVNTFGRDESSSHYLFRVTFHAHAGGTYYIAASGESFEWGSYKLRVKDITDDPH